MRRPLIFDLIASQSVHNRDRGIARYVTELALAIHRQDQTSNVRYAVSPDLTFSGSLDPLVSAGSLVANYDTGPDGEAPLGEFDYLVGSPFEGHALDTLVPRYVRTSPNARLIVILYDLIPFLYADHYMHDHRAKSFYYGHLELVRSADLVLAISESTKRDAISILGLPPEKVATIMAGVHDAFQPPAERDQAFAYAQQALPELRQGFIFYAGGVDFRKNIEGLIHGYSKLPSELRASHQLVITCKMLDSEKDHYRVTAERWNVGPHVLFTGFVSDSLLRSLYQTTSLFVFPSLYEGFGLPIAEALACGATTVGSSSSSMREILVDDALLFDAGDPLDITRAIEFGLTDNRARTISEQVAAIARHRFTWDAVANATVGILSSTAESTNIAHRMRRPRLAIATPWYPDFTGVADYSARLVDALRRRGVLTDVFVPQSGGILDTQENGQLVSLDNLEDLDLIHPYDVVIYAMGNSSFHGDIYETALRRPGVILAHDIRLNDFYTWYWQDRGFPVEWFHRRVHEMHPYLNPAIGVDGWISADIADLFGIFMVKEILSTTSKMLVHSAFAQRMLELVHPDLSPKVAKIAFGHDTPVNQRSTSLTPTISTFGLAHPVKLIHQLVEALPDVVGQYPEARLRIVGHIETDYESELLSQATSLGVDQAIEITGLKDRAAYLKELSAATIAVQLRAHSNGETSAATADCLSHGIPTIVTDIGAAGSIPEGVVHHLPVGAPSRAIARTINDLLADSTRLAEMALRATAYAAANSFDQAAEALLNAVLQPSTLGT